MNLKKLLFQHSEPLRFTQSRWTNGKEANYLKWVQNILWKKILSKINHSIYYRKCCLKILPCLQMCFWLVFVCQSNSIFSTFFTEYIPITSSLFLKVLYLCHKLEYGFNYTGVQFWYYSSNGSLHNWTKITERRL